MKKFLLAAIVLTGLLVSNVSRACDAGEKNDATAAFRGAMQKIWNDHMQWTFASVDAFFHNPKGIEAQLNRLLQNQKDIGAAFVPVYGQSAGDQLAKLLTAHIQQAVPVLTAAKNNDQAALKKALDDWYINAREIADFLARSNPNWKQEDMRTMMKTHIDQTTAYAMDLLKDDYVNAIIKYDEANNHMKMMADELSNGIIKQFPSKFKELNKSK